MVGEIQKDLRKELFGALEIDYPWGIDFSTKDGKQFLNYETQSIQNLYNLEIEHLQDSGYLFMWTVAQKFLEAAAFMTHKGYKIVDTLVWIKEGVHSEYKNRTGYYFRHNKEVCILGLKGTPPSQTQPFTASDLIKTIPGKNSEKPKEIKDTIKTLIPGVFYCEIFARNNNVCEDFVSIGNELTIGQQ